ncbi:MAG: hypothetical protein H0T73_23475 [Ardenticatenales bacterium]|nr:hypothetical protein [Ardenticatenales bacterium]
MMVLAACQSQQQEPEPAPPSPPVNTPLMLSPSPAVAVVVEPTPAIATLRVWGPVDFDPQRPNADAEIWQQQQSDFETVHPEIEMVYEAKPLTGPASLLTYLNAASSVAPSVLPDLIIIPVTALAEAAQTGRLFPLDSLIAAPIQEDFYPFAIRDTSVEGQWLALPLAVRIEHGLTRSGRRGQIPLTLDKMASDSAPTWLFSAQDSANGEVSNALLLQLLAITAPRPGPESLPTEANLVALFTALQAAQGAGTIPNQVLLLAESDDLVGRLENGEAELIEGNSYRYLEERRQGTSVTFAPIPTLFGHPVTVVDGYLIALTTDEPRQQAAAISYISWILTPSRLAAWSRASHWVPARRSALAAAIDEDSYRTFLAERLENGWLRPSDAPWRDFGQTLHAQFRALLLGHISPAQAAETIIDRYEP